MFKFGFIGELKSLLHGGVGGFAPDTKNAKGGGVGGGNALRRAAKAARKFAITKKRMEQGKYNKTSM